MIKGTTFIWLLRAASYKQLLQFTKLCLYHMCEEMWFSKHAREEHRLLIHTHTFKMAKKNAVNFLMTNDKITENYECSKN